MAVIRSAPVCGEKHEDAVHEQQVLQCMMTEEAAVDAAALFSYLSDTTRVRLLSMLATSEMCVCEMADILGMSQPALSHHLRVLRQCGVIGFRKQGQKAVYYLNEDEMGGKVRQLLCTVCRREDK